MRKKVELAYIAGNSARRSAYQKRKKGLLKKANELTTLCGVEACLVIHSAYEASPVAWPDNERALRVLQDLQEMPETEQRGKVYDHAAYLRKRISKAAKDLTRLQRDSRQKEAAAALRSALNGELRVEGMNAADLGELRSMIDMDLEEIDCQLQRLEEQEPQPLQVLPALDPEMEGGIPGGDVGPMGQLLSEMEPSDAGFGGASG